MCRVGTCARNQRLLVYGKRSNHHPAGDTAMTSARRVTLNAINAELARRGHAERLVRGAGYFYFVDGTTDGWYGCSVATMHLSGLTVEQWANERDELARDYRNSNPEGAE